MLNDASRRGEGKFSSRALDYHGDDLNLKAVAAFLQPSFNIVRVPTGDG